MELLQNYQNHIIYLTAVIACVYVLRLVTNFFYKKAVVKAKEKLQDYKGDTLILIKRVLNILWFVLGFLALAFLWVAESNYERLQGNIKLISFLGIVTVVTIGLASATNIWFLSQIRKKSFENIDVTNLKFLRYVVVSLVYLFGSIVALYAFPSFKIVAQTALGSAGVIALVAGYSSQEALANLVSGIFIISFKPFKIGDIIIIDGGMEGQVADITLRHTVIRNFDNRMIVIPNSIINKEKLINADLGERKCCERLQIGISYSSDVKLAKKIMQEECEKHPLILDNRTKQQKKQEAPLLKLLLLVWMTVR